MGISKRIYRFLAETGNKGQIRQTWAMRYHLGWTGAKAAMQANAAIPTVSSIRAFGPNDPEPAAYRVK